MSFTSLNTSLLPNLFMWKRGWFAWKWTAGGTHFYMNGFARKLSLTQRQKVLGSGIIKLYKRYKDIWLACLIQTLLVKTWFFSSWKTEMKTEMIQFEYHFTKQNQEIIKVREWIFHIGLTSKVSPLKLFIDIVPSSSEDITRASRGCFRRQRICLCHFISFCFKAKDNLQRGGDVFDYKQESLGSR